MKTLKCITAFLIIFTVCKSQKYDHFINKSKQWKCAYALPIETKSVNNSNFPYYALCINYFKGDTIINGIEYSMSLFKTVLPSSTDTIVSKSGYYLYEDTLNMKIYMLDQIYSHSNVLLYDFSLNEGDSVHTYIVSNIYYNGKVKKVDSVYLSNKFLKRIRFTDGLEWIEGIGSTTSVTYPSVYDGLLICVNENNNVLYLDTVFFENCDTVFSDTLRTQLNFINNSIYKINIYPNPINQYSVLTVEAMEDEQFKLEIYNDNGILIIQELFIGNYPIGTLPLKSGLYICRILYKGEPIGYKKIILTNS